jgi:hypothetical protein
MWLSYLQNIPNEVVLRNIAQKFDKEYNPEARIKRYKTLTPELMELATLLTS